MGGIWEKWDGMGKKWDRIGLDGMVWRGMQEMEWIGLCVREGKVIKWHEQNPDPGARSLDLFILVGCFFSLFFFFNSFFGVLSPPIFLFGSSSFPYP